ncbi:hypothetical protein [uncultured Clostridium sp.]|uniref:hypothetical protein n=1 Tax=uncultured Clostridium sp. TaxID=59620 RepID=UPI0026EC68D3|nr:hypothetical protein [uncultured Clostridium sp.]
MDKNSDILNELEIEKAKMCISNLVDKIRAIDIEMLGSNPHKSYLNEKLQSILWDTNVLINICSNEEV